MTSVASLVCSAWGSTNNATAQSVYIKPDQPDQPDQTKRGAIAVVRWWGSIPGPGAWRPVGGASPPGRRGGSSNSGAGRCPQTARHSPARRRCGRTSAGVLPGLGLPRRPSRAPEAFRPVLSVRAAEVRVRASCSTSASASASPRSLHSFPCTIAPRPHGAQCDRRRLYEACSLNGTFNTTSLPHPLDFYFTERIMKSD
jgi:hypothetical protein